MDDSSLLNNLEWLQSDTVCFVADSDVEAEESLVKEAEGMSFNDKPYIRPQVSQASWGPIRRERWRQRQLKEQEKDISIRDWLLTGTYPHSNVMIDAGLYGIDVSDWKDEDFQTTEGEQSKVDFSDVDVSNWTSDDL